MKKLLLILTVSFLAISQLQAQNDVVISSSSGAASDASAILDIQSKTKGLLIPRMTITERDNISSPAEGLLVYVTNSIKPFFSYYTGTSWIGLPASTSGTSILSIDDLSDGISDNTKNVFLGTGVGINNVESGAWAGQYNVGLGIEALNQGVNNSKSVAIGFKALHNNNSTRNTAIGYLALETVATGAGNTAIGPEALRLAIGGNNTALGQFGLSTLVVGNSNTSIGTHAGAGLTVGTGNVFLGYGAGDTQTDGDENIAIGTSVELENLSASNQMNIGNTIYATGMKTASVKVGIGNENNAPSSTLDVNGEHGYNQLRLQKNFTPTGSADANGSVGDIAWDDNYFYVKTSTGWKRTVLATW